MRANKQSLDGAIVVSGGVPAEYRYLERLFGRRGVDWALVTQSFIARDGRSYDELLLWTSGGVRKVVFDIGASFDR